MTPDLQFPPVTAAPNTRTRVKWENLAILAGGAVVATFAVVVVLMHGAEQPAATASHHTAPEAAAPVADETVAAAGSELTMADAVGLVDEARQLIGEARWDEASDRLASVPDELREAAGASALATQLESTRTRHEQLRAELTAAVEARQWSDATSILERLAEIAPLDAELQAQQALVQEALAPAPTEARATAVSAAAPNRPAAAAPATPTGGGSTRPQAGAQSARPAASGGASSTAPAPARAPSPSAAGRPAAQGAVATAPAALDPLAPIELTPEQEAELAAALGLPAGELQ